MRKERVRCNAKLLVYLYVLFLFISLPVHGETGGKVESSDLRFILRDLAASAGVRILMDSTVNATVTIELRENIPAKSALELLAVTYGYTFKWVEDGKTIIIGNTDTFKQTKNEETIEYQLKNIDPERILLRLKSVLPQERIRIEQKTKKLIITGNTLEQSNVADIIKYYDQTQNKYILDVLLEEVSVEAIEKSGFIADDVSIGSSLYFNVIDLDWIKGLEEQNHAGLLASSRIITVAEKENNIFVGDRYPVIFTQITEKGVEEFISYKKVGIDLFVLPSALEQNMVTLTLRAEVNSISDWQRTAKGNDIPIITKTEGSSGRRLRLGEAFVLTGFTLIKEGDEERVPPGLLGLPVIGEVIQARGQVTVKNNFGEKRMLCLVLVPRIAKADSQINGHVIKDDKNSLSTGLPGASITTTEIYSITDEPIEQGTQEIIPKVETEVEQVGGAEIQEEEDKQNSEINDSSNVPAIEVVITDDTDPTSQNTTPEKQQTEERGVLVGLNIPYSVKKGDTVYAVARKFGLDPKLILQVNNMSESSTLSVEEILVLPIPAKHLYQLKPEETIWRIAKRYGLDVELLMDINSLSDVTTLKAGQVIILPVSVDRIANPEY